MLTTDAYAFLDIDNPLCAWATYRGTLVSAPQKAGSVSVWSAGLMRSFNSGRVNLELVIEDVRKDQFPQRISRLRGMFCLPDRESAERACSWNVEKKTHFQPEYLTELNLSEATVQRDRLDANWITYASISEDSYLSNNSWIHSYWSGEEYPGQTPIWETLVEGRLLVLGTDIRHRAYSAIRSEFPTSLMLLEIARMAAWMGSDLGSISASIGVEQDEICLNYVMNMVDANNPEFLEKVKSLIESGHPINRADMQPQIEQGTFGNVPDLRRYGFRHPLNKAR